MPLVLGSTATSPTSTTLYLKNFGAVGDGATDDTAAVQAAFSALKAMGGGGELIIAPGLYNFTSKIDATGLKDCRIKGTAGRNNNGTGSNPSTMLYYRGSTATAAIDLADSNGIVWDGVSVWANTSGSPKFEGVLMNFDATVSGLAVEHDIFGNKVTNCAFRSVTGTAPILFSLATAIECTFENVTFGDAGASGTQVRMINNSAAGHWSNANSFRSCSFLGTRSVSILNPATQTTLLDCTFEPTTGGLPAPIRFDALGNEEASVLTLVGCGFWDNTGTGGSWIKSTVATSAFSMMGCKAEIGPGGTFFDLSAHNSLAVIGCRFDAPGGGTPNIFTPAQNVTNGSWLSNYVKSPVVDNHASVFV